MLKAESYMVLYTSNGSGTLQTKCQQQIHSLYLKAQQDYPIWQLLKLKTHTKYYQSSLYLYSVSTKQEENSGLFKSFTVNKELKWNFQNKI